MTVLKVPEVAVANDVCLEASEVTVLTLQPLLSQWVTVTVVYDFGEMVVAAVSLEHSEVTVLVLQPLSSQ